ncbi:MAG: hypothetical protein IKU43_07340 [Clostridia bacterium]|nr:hypothetical protein [Clostridia bacterium]
MKEIFYQLALRTFTPEGTLNAAKERLGHVASLGTTVLYLCPCFVEDDDPDMATWSPRQVASRTLNPKNPYKITDYFSVDNEFGCDEDLVEFIKEAHRLGMKVLLDLVYLHCGKNAPFIKEHPDYVLRNEDGTTLVGEMWPFARLDFSNADAREYLLSNMKHLIEYYDCDGFRCDCGNMIPIDFWRDSFKETSKLKEGLIYLNEGNLEDGRDEIFDIAYNWGWRTVLIETIHDGKSADVVRDYVKSIPFFPRGITYLDQHDTASDCGLARNEILFTSRGMDAAFVLTFTTSAQPLIWNGIEIADNQENSMFANRMHTKRSEINWSRAITEDGIRRLALVKKLSAIFKENDAITEERPVYIGNSASDDVITFTKSNGKETVFVAVNCRNKDVKASVDTDIEGTDLLSYGVDIKGNKIDFKPFGYTVIKLSK